MLLVKNTFSESYVNAANVSQLGEVADFEALTFNLELNFF
jgi:hypothetical protein